MRVCLFVCIVCVCVKSKIVCKTPVCEKREVEKLNKNIFVCTSAYKYVGERKRECVYSCVSDRKKEIKFVDVCVCVRVNKYSVY